jgi:hypothetical protein
LGDWIIERLGGIRAFCVQGGVFAFHVGVVLGMNRATKEKGLKLSIQALDLSWLPYVDSFLNQFVEETTQTDILLLPIHEVLEPIWAV